jgi:hypothetical protein
MVGLTKKVGNQGQLDVRWTHFDGDYPIFKFRVGDAKGRVILEGEDSGKALKMPDASKIMHSLVEDLIDCGERWDTEEPPSTLHLGYVPSEAAEWAHDALDDLYAVREALVPVMAREL